MRTWHIKKNGKDDYHVTGADQFTRIDETVDGPKLMGMLGNKTAGESNILGIMRTLDDLPINGSTALTFQTEPECFSE